MQANSAAAVRSSASYDPGARHLARCRLHRLAQTVGHPLPSHPRRRITCGRMVGDSECAGITGISWRSPEFQHGVTWRNPQVFLAVADRQMQPTEQLGSVLD